MYEGVDIKGQGTVGLITYLRTDSVRISDEADAAARAYIGERYGEEYRLQQEATQERQRQEIQDAHEAIRPTDINQYTVPRSKTLLSQRSVPSVSADLEAFCRKPYGNRRCMRQPTVKIAAGDYTFHRVSIQGRI